jgi:hypothetical protein
VTNRWGLRIRPPHVRDAYWVLSQLPLWSPGNGQIADLDSGAELFRCGRSTVWREFKAVGKKEETGTRP